MITYHAPDRPKIFSPELWRILGKEMARALRYRSERQVGIEWVDLKRMQQLNRQYRQKDHPTDVLSFTAETPKIDGVRYLGDLVICPAYASNEAKRRGIPEKEEIIRLIVHGTLHLVGYHHVTLKEEAHMFAVQERCISRILELCQPRY